MPAGAATRGHAWRVPVFLTTLLPAADWIGLVLAVVMTGVLFFGGAWGYLRLLRFPAPLDQFSQLPAHGGSLVTDHNALAALGAIVGTGLLTGILICGPRVSPLAAGLPGLLALG